MIGLTGTVPAFVSSPTGSLTETKSFEHSSPFTKPAIEFFARGHARPYLPAPSVDHAYDGDWLSCSAQPSQAYHIFTNSACGSVASCVKKCENTDNTVEIAAYNASGTLDLQQRYSDYHSLLADLGCALVKLDSACLAAVTGLQALDRLFQLFPGCLVGNSAVDTDTLDDGDVQILLDRLFLVSEASRTPPFAMQVMCALGNQKLDELEEELYSLANMVIQLADVQVDMDWWGLIPRPGKKLATDESLVARHGLPTAKPLKFRQYAEPAKGSRLTIVNHQIQRHFIKELQLPTKRNRVNVDNSQAQQFYHELQEERVAVHVPAAQRKTLKKKKKKKTENNYKVTKQTSNKRGDNAVRTRR